VYEVTALLIKAEEVFEPRESLHSLGMEVQETQTSQQRLELRPIVGVDEQIEIALPEQRLLESVITLPMAESDALSRQFLEKGPCQQQRTHLCPFRTMGLVGGSSARLSDVLQAGQLRSAAIALAQPGTPEGASRQVVNEHEHATVRGGLEAWTEVVAEALLWRVHQDSHRVAREAGEV
jgi:hypothetical protein